MAIGTWQSTATSQTNRPDLGADALFDWAPMPADTPLDCDAFNFSPGGQGEGKPSRPGARDGGHVRSGQAPAPGTTFATPEALAQAMANQGRLAFPELIRGLLQYEVADRKDGQALVVGKLGPRRLIAASAVRQPDGSWAWENARSVPNPNGVAALEGAMFYCPEIANPA